jgi:alkanesulfonate monooxygenase
MVCCSALAHTAESSPLIAVNLIYMHRFTVAKFVSSFALLYHRKVYPNMIAGTATNDLQGRGEQLSHQDRYSRLGEFIHIVRQLLASTGPVTFNGKFYTTNNLQLRPRLPSALMPEFLIAGQSDDAHRVAKQMGCLMMQMLPPNLEQGINAPGVNFGIFAREGRDQARREAMLFFQDSAEKRELLKYTMENTDSVWKRRLNDAGQKDELHENAVGFSAFDFSCGLSVPRRQLCRGRAKLGRFAEVNISTSFSTWSRKSKNFTTLAKPLHPAGYSDAFHDRT